MTMKLPMECTLANSTSRLPQAISMRIFSPWLAFILKNWAICVVPGSLLMGSKYSLVQAVLCQCPWWWSVSVLIIWLKSLWVLPLHKWLVWKASRLLSSRPSKNCLDMSHVGPEESGQPNLGQILQLTVGPHLKKKILLKKIFWPHLQHVEIPRLGIESMPQYRPELPQWQPFASKWDLHPHFFFFLILNEFLKV